MMKCSTLVWLLMAVAAAAGLFLMKYEMHVLESELATLNQDILRDQEALHVLRAEWSYLNRPARLETLGRRLLQLEPIRPEQMGSISDIPLRVEADSVADNAAPSSTATSPPAAGRFPPQFNSMKRDK